MKIGEYQECECELKDLLCGNLRVAALFDRIRYSVVTHAFSHI